MTIKNTLWWAYKKLKDSKIKSAYLDADILLAYVLQKPKSFLYSYPDYQLTNKQRRRYKKLVNKRKNHCPIAYLTGYKEFYGLKFKVNKYVLIPRPESEEIIDKALKIINKRFIKHDTSYVICDIGTGSGCLMISLAKKLQELNIINNFELIATDISRKALRVAQENAKYHQINKHIAFLKGDLLKPLQNKKVDLIIVNLPYLTKHDLKKEPSLKKEPPKALKGALYPRLFKQIKKLKKAPIVIFENKKGINILSD